MSVIKVHVISQLTAVLLQDIIDSELLVFDIFLFFRHSC